MKKKCTWLLHTAIQSKDQSPLSHLVIQDILNLVFSFVSYKLFESAVVLLQSNLLTSHYRNGRLSGLFFVALVANNMKHIEHIGSVCSLLNVCPSKSNNRQLKIFEYLTLNCSAYLSSSDFDQIASQKFLPRLSPPNTVGQSYYIPYVV